VGLVATSQLLFKFANPRVYRLRDDRCCLDTSASRSRSLTLTSMSSNLNRLGCVPEHAVSLLSRASKRS